MVRPGGRAAASQKGTSRLAGPHARRRPLMSHNSCRTPEIYRRNGGETTSQTITISSSPGATSTTVASLATPQR